ncbi:hypothetical protein [Synechococcus phage Ssp-JY38]|nr:hypothetical protein [Synechococcus phage Yong-L2-223]
MELKNRTKVEFVVQTNWPDADREHHRDMFKTYYCTAYATTAGAPMHAETLPRPKGKDTYTYDTVQEAIAAAHVLKKHGRLKVAFEKTPWAHKYAGPLRVRVITSVTLTVETLVQEIEE